MKKLFLAIRNSDINTIKEILTQNPELIACTAKQPPKKDDGQSPLQVALKTGNFDIAEYLLGLGADVNFMESEPCCNEWRAPVLHDAITAAIMNSRWNTYSDIMGGLKVYKTKEEADRAYDMLKKIIDAGADVNAIDSFGNSCLWRGCLQASQILPRYNQAENKMSGERLITEEVKADIARIFKLLIEAGADVDYIRPDIGRSIKEFYKNQTLEQFLNLSKYFCPET